MRFRSLILAIACLALAVPLLFAQTTGSVSGTVRDKDGSPLPGATVKVAGPQLPRGQSTTTLSDGSFKIPALLPGTYHVTAELAGMGKFDQDAEVQVGKDTEVRPMLRITAAETVTVTAATPLVDTKSTDISNVTTKDTIEKLPLARTFTGTFQLAPGVAENNSSAPSAGGFRQDNTFLYDGVNITNPFFGDLYQDFSELDIQEVNITRGGVTAEYGRTGGFIVNGVTKSGT
ncbi:MAG: Plug and carboxypeptidase regulatory-like domain-containing protein, partial [Acidobacteriota bacterium]|nr:Plug and carboxypeptidase regulatory-like domain-containing protein [Acidobacteriota bacterium]